GCLDELDDAADEFVPLCQVLDAGDPFDHGTAAPEQAAVRLLDATDPRALVVGALEADDVDTDQPGAVALDQGERRRVFGEHRPGADHRELPDACELLQPD